MTNSKYLNSWEKFVFKFFKLIDFFQRNLLKLFKIVWKNAYKFFQNALNVVLILAKNCLPDSWKQLNYFKEFLNITFFSTII